MPIPDQASLANLGDPNRPTSYQTYASANVLSQGTHIHYVQQDNSHLHTVICRVLNSVTGEISVAIDDANGHRTEYMNVQYDDTTKAPGTYHFPSDG